MYHDIFIKCGKKFKNHKTHSIVSIVETNNYMFEIINPQKLTANLTQNAILHQV